MITILDLDDTLFNTAKFKKDLERVFIKEGTSKKLFKQTYQLSKQNKGYWQPEIQLSFIKSYRPEIKTSLIKSQINSLFKDSKKYLFPDVFPFIKKIKRISQLVLLTFGKKDVQLAKVKYSGLISFFDKIMIARSLAKEKEISKILRRTKRQEKVIFIENAVEVIDMTKKLFPQIITIRIRRPEGRFSKKISEVADFCFDNLKEIEKIYENLKN